MRFLVFEKLRDLIDDRDPLVHHHTDRYRFGVEVTLNDPVVMRELDQAATARLVSRLEGYDRTVHLPFYGLNLGCFDRWIADYSERTLCEGIELCARIGADKAVTHTTIPALLGDHSWRRWLDRFLERMERMERYAAERSIRLVWENTYESAFDLFDAMIARYPGVRFCLDVGHVRCFAKRPITDFLDRLGARITHMHLHDNDGADDHHWPLGKGDIDFAAIATALPRTAVDTAVFELDATDLRESLPHIVHHFGPRF